MRTLLLAALCALCLALPAQAQDVKLTTYGQWEVGVGPDFADAYTINDQGQRFGVSCSGGCVGLVSPPYGCEQDDQGVALFNSDEGVLFLELECAVFEGDALFTFKDDLSDAFKNKTDVAFAFPGRKATFATMRFSLDGAAGALAHVLREVEKRSKRAPQSASDVRAASIGQWQAGGGTL